MSRSSSGLQRRIRKMNAVLERGKVASRFSLESIGKMAGRVAA